MNNYSEDVFLRLGYYFRANNNNKKMVFYFTKAYNEFNSLIAIKNLINHYRTIKNDKLIIYYLKKAIKLNDIDAIIDLTDYYCIKNNYQNVVKLYKNYMSKINENNEEINDCIILKFTKYINKLNNTKYDFNYDVTLLNDYPT